MADQRSLFNNGCPFCSGDPTAPDHLEHCDGRQGAVEAEDAVTNAIEDVAEEHTEDACAETVKADDRHWDQLLANRLPSFTDAAATPPPDIELHARSTDPATSHEAMEQYDKERLASASDHIVELLRTRGPMADFQQQTAFAQTWKSPCCAHLYQQARSTARDQGRIVNTGEKIVNPATNRKQVVWAYAPNPVPPTLRYCPTCGGLVRRSAEAS